MAPNFPFEMPALKKISILLLFSLIACANSNPPIQNCSTGISVNQSTRLTFAVSASGNENKKLCIFCYPGQERSWFQLWVNPKITVEEKKGIPLDDLMVYYGKNVSDVEKQSASSVLSALSSFLLLKAEHSFTPFNHSCIGLSSRKSYTVHVRVKNPDLWYLAYIAIGITIFFCAPSWSRNIALHYGTGMTFGILASVLIIMFLLTRLMPQRLKTVSYVVMAVSSSASLFMYQLVKTYLQEIIQDHWQYALGYVVVSALLSFALIYRFGPITDGRTLNLVCWVMQALGLGLIYQGTQIPEASAAIILLVLTVYICPKRTPLWMKRLRSRLFPRRHRFLTEEEFLREGEEETRKALLELRQYCHSPDCNTWRVVSHLKSPNRFASFVDGDPHLSDAEMEEHERFIHYNAFQQHNNPYSASDTDNNSDLDAETQPQFVPRPSNHFHHDDFSEDESDIEETAYQRNYPWR